MNSVQVLQTFCSEDVFDLITDPIIISDGPIINYNRKSVGLGRWTDDQAQS